MADSEQVPKNIEIIKCISWGICRRSNMRTRTTAVATLILMIAATIGFAQSSDVKKEINETLQAIAATTEEQRDQAKLKAEELLERLDTQIRNLEAGIDKRSGEMTWAAKLRLSSNLRQLKRRRNDLAKRYDALREDTKQAWEDIRSGFVDGVRAVTEKLDDAAAKLERQTK
jgi:ABC-type transporter MlaC component